MKQRGKEKEKQPKKQQPTICHHFWVIDEANGPSSFGKCKFCGQKKEFMNAFPTFNPLKKNANLFKLNGLAGVTVKANNNRSAR